VAVDWIGLYLLEDLPGPDVTSEAVFAASHRSAARIVARERLLVAGTVHAREVFARLGADAVIEAPDGTWADAGSVLLRVEGPTRALLAGERLALNLMARMSGIAGLTRSLQEKLADLCSSARVAGTRKTTPGFRFFEKDAIRIGGGDPHRSNLNESAMVKDNHREAAGSVSEAVRRIKAAWPDKVVSCEVESLEDALSAAAAGSDWILIDNQAATTGFAWAQKVWLQFPNVHVEASGGIRPETVVDYAWADRISLGALTQKASAKDLSMEWVKNI
jgi:nicotinate-nucleotide pyrophosphorylase (carboxylating)